MEKTQRTLSAPIFSKIFQIYLESRWYFPAPIFKVSTPLSSPKDQLGVAPSSVARSIQALEDALLKLPQRLAGLEAELLEHRGSCVGVHLEGAHGIALEIADDLQGARGTSAGGRIQLLRGLDAAEEFAKAKSSSVATAIKRLDEALASRLRVARAAERADAAELADALREWREVGDG